MARLKRLDGWRAFCDAVASSYSVRRSARVVGIACSTAFRWRHRLLDAVRSADLGVLSGEVAVSETCFAVSEKGRRDLDRPPRRRAAPLGLPGPRVWVILARDAAGRPVAVVAGARRPHARELAQGLLPRLGPGVTLSDVAGPLGGAACLARQEGLGYRRRSWAEKPPHPAVVHGCELRRWLRRFRGVATRHLPNYLSWHRLLALAGLAGLERSSVADRLLVLATP
jgi:transposase-like protein